MQYMILAIKTSSFTGRKWVLDDGKCNLNVKTEEISMYS